ncbi:SURF1 family protein [Marinobacter halodurans]|uniref:SURF1-like protein n=1 Tax=Marinobacter halodurans TaxID=2528979 RepID=A0ABY1ZL94_9GAMM|nr:SURF1 family protein [Marinobacter halodurans]TBW56492.1 SURF1 family protein [Marinobacter halodurans]
MAERVQRRWQPDWRLWLLAFLLLPVLVGLGIWQLDRAGEKEAMLARWNQQLQSGSWPQALDAGLTDGQPVELRGHYRADHQWLLDNRTRDGRPGYEVLTLFEPEAGPPVLVNRGWLQAPRRRDELPGLVTPRDTVTIRARVADYPTPPVLEQTRPESDWPRRVQALHPDEVRQQAPQAIDRLLRLEDPAQPGAYRADFAPNLMGPQTHYGYAAQWFTMAAVLVVLTIVASYRKQQGQDQDDAGND